MVVSANMIENPQILYLVTTNQTILHQNIYQPWPINILTQCPTLKTLVIKNAASKHTHLCQEQLPDDTLPQ